MNISKNPAPRANAGNRANSKVEQQQIIASSVDWEADPAAIWFARWFGGSVVVYSVTPHIEWRSHREAPLARLRPLNGGATPAATPADALKRAVDMALGAFADIERRARDAQPESTTSIAAE